MHKISDNQCQDRVGFEAAVYQKLMFELIYKSESVEYPEMLSFLHMKATRLPALALHLCLHRKKAY